MVDFKNIFPNAEQIDTTNALLAIIAANSDTGIGTTSWRMVAQITRMGLAPKLFPVGYEFTTEDADTGRNVVWAVRGHDHHKAANPHLTHTMTLETKCAYSPMFIQARQALYAASAGLEPGTYHFTVANHAWCPADDGRSVQFTLTKPIPAGGQICILSSRFESVLHAELVSYESPSAKEPIETFAAAEGNAGTDLGQTGKTACLNHMQRASLDSDNYAQSAVRQFLNSAGAAGSVWQPQTKFDRPPTWEGTDHGFLHGLPEDFLEVVQPAVVPYRTNGLYETESLDGTPFAVNQTYSVEDRFFLLSQPEVYGTLDSEALKDGELLPYYDGLTDTERIKRDENGMEKYVWLRSPTPADAYGLHAMGTDGGMTSSGSYGDFRLSPACIIA